MDSGDVPQVAQIDREAFPNMLPYPNYYHELQNSLAHYIVAWDKEPVDDKKSSSFITRWLVNHGLAPKKRAGTRHVVGFAGLWILVDEAHLINIAVREQYRRRGVGELLLISAIDLVLKMNTSIITLEVRASNSAAQNLYRKYGFAEVGVRRHYYSDNREDAVLMTAENINSALFQARFQQLQTALYQKLGLPEKG